MALTKGLILTDSFSPRPAAAEEMLSEGSSDQLRQAGMEGGGTWWDEVRKVRSLMRGRNSQGGPKEGEAGPIGKAQKR